MGFRICRRRARTRPRRFQGLNRLDQVLVDAPLEGFQAAPLWIGQIARERERPQVGQNAVEMLQPPFQFVGAWCLRGRRVGPEGALGIGQDVSPVHLVGDPVRRHQDRRIRGGQRVSQYRLEHHVLILSRERGQGIRGGWPKASSCQFVTGALGEPRRELKTTRYPVRPLAQQEGDGVHLEVMVGAKRCDDARLIERGHGAGRRVGHQHEPRVLDGRQRQLHDGGHGPAPRIAPAVNPLEPVQNLVVSVVRGHDADRPIGERGVGRTELPRPEGGEVDADQVDWELPHGPDAARAGALVLVLAVRGRGSVTAHACDPWARCPRRSSRRSTRR